MARAMKDSGIEWIGKIPEEWRVVRGKTVFRQRNEKGNEVCLQLLSPSQKYGVIPQAEYEQLSGMKAVKLDVAADFSQLKTIHAGDFCISLRSFQGGFEYSQHEGVVSPAYQVFYPHIECNDGYFKYLFKDRTFIDKMNSYTLSLRDGKNIAFSDFANTYIPFPPIDEQTRIAAFLDTECARIDAVIEQTRASIEEYKKLKQSIITQAVTKGIRPGQKMKDSGVEWIGEIPEEWSINPLGKGLELIQTGPFGSQLHADEYINNGIVVVNPANISNGEIIPDEKCTITREKAQELSRHMLKMGDIVFGRRGEMGRSACVIDSSHEYFCGTGCLQIRCNEALKPRYASYYLQNPCIKQYLELHAVGTTMQNLNTTIVSGIPIVYGTLSEQEEIVDYIDCKRAEIDQLICAKQQFLSELEFYKKSLIFEYVTGKKET